MKKLSNSTKLINLFIGLSQQNPHIKPILYNSGYQLEWIEPHFLNNNGETINPDLQFFSQNDENLLFVECKLGGFEEDQASRYKKLKKEDIIQSNVTELDMSKSDFEILYCCDEENKTKLIKGDEVNNWGFPIASCNDTGLTLERNEIKGKELKKIFENDIEIPEKISLEYYPYGPDDSIGYIAPSIFQSLLKLTGEGQEEITVESVIKESHPLYNSIHSAGQNKLKQKVGKILNDLEQNELNEVMKTLKGPHRYKIISRSYTKFRNICLKLISNYEEKRKQSTFSDFPSQKQ